MYKGRTQHVMIVIRVDGYKHKDAAINNRSTTILHLTKKHYIHKITDDTTDVPMPDTSVN